MLPAKDCACATHEGPHWLHMDALWRARNRAILQRMRDALAAGNHWDASLAAFAFAREEECRLAEKALHLRRSPTTPGGD